MNPTQTISNGQKSVNKESIYEQSKIPTELQTMINKISKYINPNSTNTSSEPHYHHKNLQDVRKKIQGWKHELEANYLEDLSQDDTDQTGKQPPTRLRQALGLGSLQQEIAKLGLTKENRKNRQILESRKYLLKKQRKALFKFSQSLDDAQMKEGFRVVNIFEDVGSKNHEFQLRNSGKIQSAINKLVFGLFGVPEHDHLFDQIASKHRVNFDNRCARFYQRIGYNHDDFTNIRKYKITAEIPSLGYNYDKVRNMYSNQQPYFQIKKKQIEEQPLQIQTYNQYPELAVPSGSYQLPSEQIFKLQWSKQIKNIFKISRTQQKIKLQREGILKRIALAVIRQINKRYIKCQKTQKDHVTRAKRLHRQTLIYWRKREKELIEVKKKKQKLEAELRKRDQEQRQSILQVKRLQFLMKQSDIYAHFMAKKLGMTIGNQGAPNQNKPEVDIDQQAAQLNITEMMNQQKQNLKKYQINQTASDNYKVNFAEVDQDSFHQLINAPSSFRGTLKQYQLKGLRWLDNLYEQGINGILADEMGLGKTIQAIALLSHISENKKIWGPFLVVAPSSTLFNWQQQIKKFCPSLRILPYWGNLKQRKTIRKFFSSKKFLGVPESPFHIVITSYQLIVTDQKTFHRLKWQYMILDQAQAIKNISSQRWKTLMGFQARNKLLLTGTPIQNTMAQLWALLHFIMPKLFDSHEQFQQWFSKDIQAHSQDQKALNQHQIQRLHAILKPFMLRRIKKDVEHQIGKKIQHQIICQMTKRQQHLYDSIKQKINVKEFFKMFQSKMKVENLMNLVMQFRKVCNHPQLFERRPSRSAFLFHDMYYYTGHQPVKYGDIKLIACHSKNPISYLYPKLVYDDLLSKQESRLQLAKRILNINNVSNILHKNNNTYSFSTIMGFSAQQIQFCFRQDQLYTQVVLLHWLKRNQYSSTLSISQTVYLYEQNCPKQFKIDRLKYQNLFVYIPLAIAPQIQIQIPSKRFNNNNEFMKNNNYHQFIFNGANQEIYDKYNNCFNGIMNDVKLLHIEVVDFASLIADSTKLRQLDKILKQKKANGDRILIFCQMTKMLDILEDFMNKKKYTFFRLDGSLNIADRRDMVNQFQINPKIFAFLLSTRAGGLGVTLTAANTVIFYDNDWNPTMDAQATDRAHRIGQRSDVNVYRLITKGTIEQRIVKRAQQKQTVQSTVYEGATFKADVFKPQQIIQLVFDQNEIQNDENQKLINKHKQKQQQRSKKSTTVTANINK